MAAVLSTQRKEELRRRFVLTIENDGTWYTRAKLAVEGKVDAVARFVVACDRHIDIVQRSGNGGCGLSNASREWIICALMEGFFIDTPAPPEFLAYYRTVHPVQRIDPGTITHELVSRSWDDKFNLTGTGRGRWSTAATFFSTPTQEPIMNPNLPFVTKHYVYGNDTATMNEAQLIEAIKKIEAEIADLSTVKAKSTKIDLKIIELTSMLSTVVAVLDAK